MTVMSATGHLKTARNHSTCRLGSTSAARSPLTDTTIVGRVTAAVAPTSTRVGPPTTGLTTTGQGQVMKGKHDPHPNRTASYNAFLGFLFVVDEYCCLNDLNCHILKL